VKTDLALMTYESEDSPEARIAGTGPCIHHWVWKSPTARRSPKTIERHGGTVLSKPDANALKFRGPDGNVAEIVTVGAFEKLKQTAAR